MTSRSEPQRSIGGALSAEALAMMHFVTLDHSEQVGAIRRMAASGWSEFTIARATRWTVEMVRRVLAEVTP